MKKLMYNHAILQMNRPKMHLTSIQISIVSNSIEFALD